ncbi:SPW repeat domain-containing protein [Shimia sp.]|uniref:SPW repeat domain-containing protein n=1 Tax=Shimia sp. TaxID=1954381 RepID=UPI003BAD6BD7
MFPRFITKNIHAYLDYPVAFGLIAMPFLFGLGETAPLAFWLSVLTGIAAFLLTVLTDHHLGLIRVLPYSVHLAVDGLVGVVFVAAPMLLGFTGLEFWYYTILGLTVLLVVGLHQSDEQTATA